MSDNKLTKVILTANFIGLWLINGGDTVAMSFQVTDGSETTILVPRNLALSVQSQLTNILEVPLAQRSYDA